MQKPEEQQEPVAPTTPLETAAKAIEQADEMVRKDPRSWEEALKSLDSAIEELSAAEVEDAEAKSHLIGWARMGKGNILVNTNARPNLETALAEYSEAQKSIESIADRNAAQDADLAAILGNIGHTSFRLGSPEQLAKSQESFDRAIAILETLPWQDNLRFRHQLATTWLNLGNTLARLGQPNTPNNSAIEAYDKALEYTAELAAEDNSFAVLRAAIRASVGRAIMWSAEPKDLERAGREFEGAIRILEKLPFKEDQRLALELAVNHANRATLLGRAKPTKESIQATLKSGEIALQLAGPGEQANLFAAEAAINARRAICHAFGVIIGSQEEKARAEIHDKATDLIEDGLKVIRLWEERSAQGMRPSAQHLFHLGCAFYCLQQPQFLVEFVNDYLDADDQVMRQSAANSLRQASQNPDQNLDEAVAADIKAKLAELS